MLQIPQPYTPPRGLVGVGGADAPLGSSDAGFGAERLLFQPVDQGVKGQHDVRPLREPEVRGVYAAGLQLGDLLEQVVRVDHGPGAHHAAGLGVEDARWHKMQLEGAVIVHHGVAGVVPALKADDHVGALGQVVDDATFAFIAPLGAYNRGNRHFCLQSKRLAEC